jgi:hypothetical protein
MSFAVVNRMNQAPTPLRTVQQFIDKWPTEKVAQIQDPIVREMMVDLVHVVRGIEDESEFASRQASDAIHDAERAMSRATWGLFGGWG